MWRPGQIAFLVGTIGVIFSYSGCFYEPPSWIAKHDSLVHIPNPA